MKYRVTHTTSYQYGEEVSVCHNKLHLAPRNLETQQLTSFRLVVQPEPAVMSRQVDYFANRVDYFAIQEPHRSLRITAISDLSVRSADRSALESAEPCSWKDLVTRLRDEPAYRREFQLTFPSQFVPVNQELAEYARESFESHACVLEGAKDLTSRIHRDFKYDPRATTVSTPVEQVFQQRAGVCQDFAHLQIACLRSLGLPARYVSGYLRTLPPPGKPRLVGADASHAWLSVFSGPDIGWVDLDPTNDLIPRTDHVTIGWGRDYADLCPIQGVFTGGGQHTMSVSVDVATVE